MNRALKFIIPLVLAARVCAFGTVGATERLVTASIEQEVNSYFGTDGQRTGMVLNLVQWGMDRMGVEVEFRLLPWKRTIKGTPMLENIRVSQAPNTIH